MQASCDSRASVPSVALSNLSYSPMRPERTPAFQVSSHHGIKVMVHKTKQVEHFQIVGTHATSLGGHNNQIQQNWDLLEPKQKFFSPFGKENLGNTENFAQTLQRLFRITKIKFYFPLFIALETSHTLRDTTWPHFSLLKKVQPRW